MSRGSLIALLAILIVGMAVLWGLLKYYESLREKKAGTFWKETAPTGRITSHASPRQSILSA